MLFPLPAFSLPRLPELFFRQVDEREPGFVQVGTEHKIDEGPELGPVGFSDQKHIGFGGKAVSFARIAPQTGGDNVFPGGFPSSFTGDYMVQIKLLLRIRPAAILAGVIIPLKEV